MKGRNRVLATFATPNVWPEKFTVPIVWNVREEYELSSDVMFLGTVKRGESVDKRLFVTSDSGSAAQVTKVAVSGLADAEAKIEDSLGSVVPIAVTWTPVGGAGVKEGKVSVHIDKEEKARTFRVAGYVVDDEVSE